MPNELPFTLDIYKQQLRQMLSQPLPGQLQPAGTSLMDKLRMAAQNLTAASTAIAGSTL